MNPAPEGEYRITRFLWGKRVEPVSYALTRSLFLRGLAGIYLMAFLSLPPQILGLMGKKGIAPACDYLGAVHSAYGSAAYSLVPTLAWFSCSDGSLLVMSWVGVVLSLLLLIGIVPMVGAVGLYILYLSIVGIGQPFFPFQWDALILETGFSAILVTPFGIWPKWSKATSPIGTWVLRLVVFRLMLESGMVKLLSGDPNWKNLTALNVHYETQPLPTPLAWYAHQLPAWFQRFSVGTVFAVELVVPFLFLMPRKLRISGAWITIGFQLLIALTGNYTFFNFLTMVLCISLFDDQHVRALLRIGRQAEAPGSALKRFRLVTIPVGILLITLGLLQLSTMLGFPRTFPQPVASLNFQAQTFQVVNRYGLFAVMTTMRPEIVIEGSDDGVEWKPYEFKFKAGDVRRPLRWVAPYQPRLDWQMWFAALEGVPEPWFTQFVLRLKESAPEVLRLLDSNPFPDHSPQHIRALLYDYRFTDSMTRRTTGAIWTRQVIRQLFEL